MVASIRLALPRQRLSSAIATISYTIFVYIKQVYRLVFTTCARWTRSALYEMIPSKRDERDIYLHIVLLIPTQRVPSAIVCWGNINSLSSHTELALSWPSWHLQQKRRPRYQFDLPMIDAPKPRNAEKYLNVGCGFDFGFGFGFGFSRHLQSSTTSVSVSVAVSVVGALFAGILYTLYFVCKV